MRRKTLSRDLLVGLLPGIPFFNPRLPPHRRPRAGAGLGGRGVQGHRRQESSESGWRVNGIPGESAFVPLERGQVHLRNGDRFIIISASGLFRELTIPWPWIRRIRNAAGELTDASRSNEPICHPRPARPATIRAGWQRAVDCWVSMKESPIIPGPLSPRL